MRFNCIHENSIEHFEIKRERLSTYLLPNQYMYTEIKGDSPD